jgi:hypothetical protein
MSKKAMCPYIVRRNGEVLHRASGFLLGHVKFYKGDPSQETLSCWGAWLPDELEEEVTSVSEEMFVADWVFSRDDAVGLLVDPRLIEPPAYTSRHRSAKKLSLPKWEAHYKGVLNLLGGKP